MKQSFRIPTLIALVLLLIGMSFIVVAGEQITSFVTRASGSYAPQAVTVANITDSSVTISWITETATSSFVKLSKTGLTLKQYSAIDIRDHGNTPITRRVHSVLLSNLEPLSEYRFEIVSGGKTFTPENALVKTGVFLTMPTHEIDPAYGTLTDEKNQLVSEAIVYASFDGSQTISTLVDNGAWILPLGTLRNREGTRYFIPQKSETEHISFVNNKAKSEITTTIDNDSPVPAIRLGQDYDFTRKSVSHPGLIIAQAKSAPESLASVQGSGTFTINSPVADANIPSGKPAFKGTGIAGKFVILTITGKEIAPVPAKIMVDGNNRWTWTPKTSLPPGAYQFTAASFTALDKPQVLSQSFSILKSGTSVLQAATPAASLKPASPTPKPSIATSPTASATPVPVTGTWELTLGLLLLGIALLAAGFFGMMKTKTAYTSLPMNHEDISDQQNPT